MPRSKNPNRVFRKMIRRSLKTPQENVNDLASKFEGAKLSTGNGGLFKERVTSVFGPPPPSSGRLAVEMLKQSFNTGSNAQQPPTRSVGNFQNARQGSGIGNEIDIKPHGPFPELIIFYGATEKRGQLFLKKSFLESPYGRLEKNVVKNGSMFIVTMLCNGRILSEGESSTRIDAEEKAVARLLLSLRKTNYFIEAKSSFFPKYRVPDCVLNVDPALSHVYKVVCLKKPHWPKFPHSLAGAVEYVGSEDELWKYIEHHGVTEPTAELFVLNIEKAQRKIVKEICQKTGMAFRPLNGCKDRGAVVWHEQNVYAIFDELKQCGGDNLKYHLYPPGSDFGNIHLDHEDGGGSDIEDEDESDGEGEDWNEAQDQDIPYDPWIADNLILMDVYNRMSDSVTPRELLFCSVRDCPALHRFIIEKKQDKVTRLITAEAQIDGKVVGRGKGYTEKRAKKVAAASAVRNLMRYCYYIQGKPSYFGVKGDVPQYLYDKRPGFQSKVCCIADPKEVSTRKELETLLKQFVTRTPQDLFFLDDFPSHIRRMVTQVAKKMNLSTRIFGNYCLCVYKKLRPKIVLKELLATRRHENEKFVLITPLSRELQSIPGTNQQSYSNKFQPKPETNQQNHQSNTANIEQLFDFENKSHVTPYEKMQEEFNHKSFRSNERPQNNNLTGPIKNWQRNASVRSTEDRGMERPFYSGGNKRSYEADVGPGLNEKRFRSNTSAWSSSQHTDKPQIVGNREESKLDVTKLFDLGGGFRKNSDNNRMDQDTPKLFDIGKEYVLDKTYPNERRGEFNLAQSKEEHQGNVSKLFDLDRNTRDLDPRTEESINRNRNQRYDLEQQDVLIKKTSSSKEFDFPYGKESTQRFEGQFPGNVISYDNRSLDQRESGTSFIDLHGKSSNLRDSSLQLKEPWYTGRRSGDQELDNWRKREPDTSTLFGRSRDFRDNSPQMEERRDFRDNSSQMEERRDFRDNSSQMEERWNKDERTSLGQAQDGRKEREPSLYERSRDWMTSRDRAQQSMNKDRSPDRIPAGWNTVPNFKESDRERIDLLNISQKPTYEAGPNRWKEREFGVTSSFEGGTDYRDSTQRKEEFLIEERRRMLNERDPGIMRGTESSNFSSFYKSEDNRNDFLQVSGRGEYNQPMRIDEGKRFNVGSDPRSSNLRAEQSLTRERSFELDRLKHRESDFNWSRDRSGGSDPRETSRRREDDRRYRDLEPSARGGVEPRSEFSQSSARGSQFNQEREQLWTKENKLLYKYDHGRMDSRHPPCHVMDLHSKIQSHLSKSSMDGVRPERRRR